MSRDGEGTAEPVANPNGPVALGTTAARAAVASWVGNSSGFALRFALNALLARYVGPTTFGVYALAFSYSELLGILAAFSFPQALVQFEGERRRLFGTVLWMSIAGSLLLLVPAVVAVPFIRTRDGGAVAGAFLALVALRTMTAISGCVEGHMQRAYSYGRLAILRVAGTALSGIAAYVAVANGWLLGALFLRDAVPLAVVLVLGGVSAVRANGSELLRTDLATASEVWSLGRSLIKVRGLEIAFTRIDQLIVGVLLGTRELGLYSQARYLATLPNAAVAPATSVVGLRVMSGVRNDPARLGRTYSVLQYGLTRVMMATGVACFVAPDLAIAIALGPEWVGASDIFRALSLWIVVLPLFELDKVLLIALRSWRGVYAAYVAMVAVLSVGTWVLTRVAGGVGAAIAVTASLLGGFFLVRVSARRRVRAELGNYWPALVGALMAIACGAGWRHTSSALGSLSEPSVALVLAVGVFFVALLALERERLVTEMTYLIGQLSGRGTVYRRDVRGS